MSGRVEVRGESGNAEQRGPRHELLTRKELSHWLGVHTATLDRWRKNGDIPESVNGRWSWTVLLAWFAELQAQATAQCAPSSGVPRTLRKAVRALLGRSPHA